MNTLVFMGLSLLTAFVGYIYFNKIESLITSEILKNDVQFVLEFGEIVQIKNNMFLFASRSWFEGYSENNCFADSRFNTENTRISSSFADFNKADIVIFHPNDFNFRRLPRERPKSQLWVWLNVEPPQNVPHLDISDDKFNYTASYKVDSDIYIPYGYFIDKPESFIFNRSYFKPFNQRQKLVCWMVSNWKSKFRNDYYNELSKYVNITIFTNINRDRSAFNKCEVLSDCKFYLSFENTNHTDYITEKLWYNAFQCGAIPIALGPSKQNYLNHKIPNDSFIHVEDFANIEDLSKYIKSVSENQTLYQTFFNWRKGRDIYFEDAFGTYYCRIVDYFNKYHPKPRRNIKIKEWFLNGWQNK